VGRIFKDSLGKPFRLTDGQSEIYSAISRKTHPRIHVQTPTRYGKSDVISMAVLSRVSMFPEKWAIVAGNKEKARIIMAYAISHIFDCPGIRAGFVMDEGESEERIRRYKNKDRINFRMLDGTLGELFITTAAGALGFGAANVVEDESALINDKDHALVMRMLGDQPENFIVKVGNPWEMDHFRKSFEDPKYHKIVIDYKQAIREGRLTPEYVEEMRRQPFFDVLYECKFPSMVTIDEKGWVPLFTRDEIEKAMVEPTPGFGINKIGVDVAGGGRNFSVIVQRHTNIAKIIHKNQDPDTMNLAESVINIRRQQNIGTDDVFVDAVGIGKGVYDILNKEIPGIYGINAGSKPTTEVEQTKFTNLRAEMYWKMREWITQGGKLEKSEDWYQLLKIRYKSKLEGRRGKMQIISKEELAAEGILSPDVADALSLTFRTNDIPPMDPEVQENIQRKEGGIDPFSPFGEL